MDTLVTLFIVTKIETGWFQPSRCIYPTIGKELPNMNYIPKQVTNKAHTYNTNHARIRARVSG